MSEACIRVISIVEAVTVTGPMKPLLMFASRAARRPTPPIHLSVITTARTSAGGLQQGNAFTAAARAAGVDVDLCPESFAGDPRVLATMARYLRQYAPDIIETHNFKCHFLFWILRLVPGLGLRKKHWIAFHHGYTKTSWRVKLYQLLDSLTLPGADRVVTLCEPFVMQLMARGVRRDRIEVISNAIEHREPPDTSDLATIRKAYELTNEDKVLLYVGRLSAEKGCRDLLDAFRKLTTRQPDLRLKLLIVGDGPDRQALTDYSRDLAGRVMFAAHQAESWQFYFLADTFVMPSHSEGSPLVLLEALSAGCAIVATKVGGIPETVVDGESALLVEAHDVPGLARALERVLTDPASAARLRAAARSRGLTFSPEGYSATLLGIYRRVLGRNASPVN